MIIIKTAIIVKNRGSAVFLPANSGETQDDFVWVAERRPRERREHLPLALEAGHVTVKEVPYEE
jgi:hypothetical protein